MQLLCFLRAVPRRSSDCSALHQPAEHVLRGIISGVKIYIYIFFTFFFISPFFLIFPFHFYIVSASHSAATGQKSAVEKLFKSLWRFIFMPKGTFFLKTSARLDCVKKATNDAQGA